jgi:hypothetical protein
MAMDAWSVQVFLRDLAAIYTAEVTGQPAGLPPLTSSYRQYAAEQRRRVEAAPARSLAYWRAQLADLPASRLRPGEPRPAPSYAATVTDLGLAAGPIAELRRALQGDRASLFMILLAAFAAAVGETTGQPEVAFGSSAAGREPHTFDLIGYFVNRLVLRVDLRGRPTFRDLVRRVRDAVLGAFAHADLPFEHLVERLRPYQYLADAPLVDLMFAFAEGGHPDFAGLGVELLRPVEPTSRFALLVSARTTARGGVHADVYRRLDEPVEGVDEVVAGFARVVRAAAADADRPVHGITGG